MVPDQLLANTAALKPYFAVSIAYVSSLKPKAAAKQKAQLRSARADDCRLCLYFPDGQLQEWTSNQLTDFAMRYTAAWCSQNPASVAAFYEEGGSLKINDGVPSIGLTAIAAAAKDFMVTFPDMVVTMDGINLAGSHSVYRWTLNGTHNG